MTGFIEIYRSRYPWKISMLIATFDKCHIPYFIQDGVASGLTLSHFTFAYLAPNIEYIIYVPNRLVRRALKVLNYLPFDSVDKPIQRGDSEYYYNLFLAILVLIPFALGIFLMGFFGH